MSDAPLPPYSPPPAVPSYSPEPAHDEQTVEHTPRAHSHPTGNYIKQCGHDAVVLAEQDPHAKFPTYGRNATINGFVSLEDRETVSDVVLKIKGKMDVIAIGASLTTKLIDSSYTVWSSENSRTSICPSALPFTVALPTKFRDFDGMSFPLPPSYDVPGTTDSGVFFKTCYTLSVTITRTRSRKFQFLTKHKTIHIPFTYSPRTRPWRPIQPFSDFMSDIKTSPAEFRQVLAQMKPRPKSLVQPIDLHLFLPIVEIFGLGDTIPFHVQLTGPVASLREFVPNSDTALGKTTIAGSLVRQIVVELNGRKALRNIVIGDAKLCSRPPGAAADMREASLDWDGEVRSNANAMVGMFDAGCVRIQDFLVIELHPPNIQTTTEFTTLRHSHPIKLVTESWLDSSAHRDDPR
ncbi:hypothetical protein B0H16DRAFT_344673 [Mycena metata]|uniref:Uncharacterized protein n=1 Tax=Mycena metata TaxID=1033252 RepID=A0AAD7HKT0_9AGAR|nr:hypothetical protein B0H16DRAFT_344673 [Mycena metata]